MDSHMIKACFRLHSDVSEVTAARVSALFRIPFTVSLLSMVFLLLPSSSQAQMVDYKNKILVVYNENFPEARELAEYYMGVRQISRDRLIAINCSVEETVTRAEYENTIRGPIEDYMIQRGWLKRAPRRIEINKRQVQVEQATKNLIWSIVLIRGIPLRISQPTPKEGEPPKGGRIMGVTNAAVDSELSLITFRGLPTQGFVGNLFWSEQKIRGFNQYFADYLIMVTRLDGPTAKDVRRMISDAVLVERTELSGRAYFDARGIKNRKDAYYLGDKWIRGTARIVKASGFETTLDENGSIYKTRLPWENVGMYAGWYEWNAKGPFTRPGFLFRPGAVAYHIHSFSAQTIRDPQKNWVGPLISRGATATMGCVYEPYLQFTPNVEVFYTCLLQGLTFGEAAYHSQSVLSWMTTMVGDPLYRPFPRNFFDTLRNAEKEKPENLEWLVLRMARLVAYQKSVPLEEKIKNFEKFANAAPTSNVYEGIALVMAERNMSPILIKQYFEKAMELAKKNDDRVRIAMRMAQYHKNRGKTADAVTILETLQATLPKESEYYQISGVLNAYTAPPKVLNKNKGKDGTVKRKTDQPKKPAKKLPGIGPGATPTMPGVTPGGTSKPLNPNNRATETYKPSLTPSIK